MAKVALHLELPIAAACWLALAAQRFALPSQGKALRCCINYACQAEGAAGLVDGIGDGGDDADSARSSTVLEVAASQIAWLESVGGARGDAARAAAGIVAACIARFPHVGAAASIFATIRCKLQTGAAACPGASAAKRALPASPASGGGSCGCGSNVLAREAPSARGGALGNLFDAAEPGAEGGALHALLCPDVDVDRRPAARASAQLPSHRGLWDAVFGAERTRERERPAATLLPQLIARATATARERAFWSLCEHHSVFQVYTREFVAAVLDCIVGGAGAAARPSAVAPAPRGEARRSVTVLEVGAGDGRFSAALLREARRRWGGGGGADARSGSAAGPCTVRAAGRAGAVHVRFVATDSGRDRIAPRSDAAPPVARVAAARALASIEGDGDIFVLCAWMPQGVDWTRRWCVRVLRARRARAARGAPRIRARRALTSLPLLRMAPTAPRQARRRARLAVPPRGPRGRRGVRRCVRDVGRRALGGVCGGVRHRRRSAAAARPGGLCEARARRFRGDHALPLRPRRRPRRGKRVARDRISARRVSPALAQEWSRHCI